MHVYTMRLIMIQNLSPHTEPRLHANDVPSPPPSLSFEPVSISLGYIMDSFQTSARLFIQDGGVSTRQNTPALHTKTQVATRVQQFAC